MLGSCELPGSVGDFTGRAAELRLLRRLAEQAGTPAATVATVSGAGGIGKTALAVHAAGQLADPFPDGRYYIDLRGMDAVPMHPAMALSRLLKALGVPERGIPGDEEERAGHYRALLRERRCLIVLDNVAHESQVRPLLPPDCTRAGPRTQDDDCGMAVRTREGWVRGPADPSAVADQLGVPETIDKIMEMYKEDRRLYKIFLDIVEANFPPEDEPDFPGEVYATLGPPRWIILELTDLERPERGHAGQGKLYRVVLGDADGNEALPTVVGSRFRQGCRHGDGGPGDNGGCVTFDGSGYVDDR